MISIQCIHIYLNLPTYSYDKIFNDRFYPIKTSITWFKTQLQIFRHTDLGNSRFERLYFFHGSHVTEHVLLSTYANFHLFAFLLKSFSVDKCINNLFNDKVRSQYHFCWGKSKRHVRNLFHSGSTKLSKRYPLL